MKAQKLLSATIAVVILLSGCSSAKKKSIAYMPSAKTIEIKSDSPIYSIWNRWNESSGDSYLVKNEEIISKRGMESFLADDPDPLVISKVQASKTWHSIGGGAFAGALATGLAAGLGYSRDDETNERAMSIPVINALWGVTGILAAFGTFSLIHANVKIDQARTLHNNRIWKKQHSTRVSLHFEVPL